MAVSVDDLAESNLVRVCWLDSFGLPGEWTSESEVPCDPCHCTSVGWVFKLTDEALTLVNHRSPHKVNSQVADYIVIPRCSIQSVKLLGRGATVRKARAAAK